MNILEAQREMRSAFLGGWLTGAILIIFAFLGRGVVLREEGKE